MIKVAAFRGGSFLFPAMVAAALTLSFPHGVCKADGDEALNESYRITLQGGAVAAGVGLVGGEQGRPNGTGGTVRGTKVRPAQPKADSTNNPGPNDLGFGTVTLSGIPAGATVVRAFVYWGLLGPASAAPVTIEGQEVTGTLVGTSSAGCWESQATWAYRADVTSIVTGNGDYFLDDFPNWQNSDSDTFGATIVAIYSDPASPMRTIVINDGSAALIQWQTGTVSTTFTGLLPLDGGSARCIYVVGDGDNWCEEDEQVFFNDVMVADSPFVHADGPYWDTTSVDVTAVYATASSTTAISPSECDCLHWVAAVLVTDGAPPLPPAPPPTGTVSGGGTVCAGTPATIQADLTGTAPWTLTWSDGFVQTVGSAPAVRSVTPTFDTTYTLTALTDSVGTATPADRTGQAVVLVKPVPTSEITADGGAVCSLRAGLGACAPDGGAGTTYAWEITGGTFTSATNTRCVTFTAATSGLLSLKVTVTKDGCSSVSVKSSEIGQAPVTPKPLIPLSGTSGYDRGFVSWVRIDDQSYPLGTRFDLYFDTVNPPEKLLFTDILDNYDAYVPVWFPNVTYYWNIVAKTPCGTASFTAPAFYAAGSCPWTGQAPALTSPGNGSTNAPTALTLHWEPVIGASHYDVYLGTSPGSMKLYRILAAPAASLDVSLNTGTTYYWKVVASPACGTTPQVPSETRSLTTITAPMTITSFSPGWTGRWMGGALELSGSGFLATSLLFTDLDGRPAGELTPGIFTNSFSNPNLLTADLAADSSAPVGFYDVGVTDGGSESARLLQKLVVRAFTDVTENDYYFLSSARVADQGIMPNDGDAAATGPQFLPAVQITRGEMAQYLAKTYRWWRFRTTGLPAASCDGPAFYDIPCDHPLWLEIHWLKTWNITTGRPCGANSCYAPDDFVTRAELVTFLQRMRQTEVLGGPRYDLLSTVGATDPGCAQAYPSCKGWTDLDYPEWPRKEVNVAFNDRMTSGCAGAPGAGLAFCPFSNVTRAEIAEFLARIVGLVPTP